VDTERTRRAFLRAFGQMPQGTKRAAGLRRDAAVGDGGVVGSEM